MRSLVVFWFQKDLRLGDNPGLLAAIDYARDNQTFFLPIFILDEALIKPDKYNIGTNRRKYLAKSLSKFIKKFQDFQILLGEPVKIFEELFATSEFDITIFVNDNLEPYALRRDRYLKKVYTDKYRIFKNESSVRLDVRTGTKNIYSVFTPFKNNVWEEFLNAPVLKYPDLDNLNYYKNPLLGKKSILTDKTEQNIYKVIKHPDKLKFSSYSLCLDELGIPESDLSWVTTTEDESIHKFIEFTKKWIHNYSESRNSLTLDVESLSTSGLSAALSIGLVSSRQLKDIVLNTEDNQLDLSEGSRVFVNELIWREFYKYLLYHYPWLLNKEFQEKKRHINWLGGQKAVKYFKRWCLGDTGYDIVDAGMKQLNQKGWMHNRTRMIVSSILTKNLGVEWRWGQEYFRNKLVDLDEASNNGGWQWGASVGADPKPIRIFNPHLQAVRYDPDFVYRFHWLGRDKFRPDDKEKYKYKQKPILEHKIARINALDRYKPIIT